MKKMVITCAVTGAETSRQQHPRLPLSPVEIAQAAHEAYLAGAAILHLHVRDPQGQPSQDVAIFRETIDRIRSKCDLVIEVTTGGAVGMTLEERLKPLELAPEMASLDCGTINFGNDYIINTLPMIRETAAIMNSHGIRPTLECFDLSHIDTARLLIEEKCIQPPFHFGLVLNSPGGVRYDLNTFSFFVERLPPKAFWTAVGIGGKTSQAIQFGAIAAGGFIRVGLEDNIYYEKGILAENNAQLVARAARMAKEGGFLIASPSDVRKLFKLKAQTHA